LIKQYQKKTTKKPKKFAHKHPQSPDSREVTDLHPTMKIQSRTYI